MDQCTISLVRRNILIYTRQKYSVVNSGNEEEILNVDNVHVCAALSEIITMQHHFREIFILQTVINYCSFLLLNIS